MQKFIKCQSLKNDFVLLDWLTKNSGSVSKTISSKNWPKTVRQMCDRYLGIGADGVLILFANNKKQLEIKIFNADGSDGGRCLNGLRCVAYYLQSPGILQMGGYSTKFAYDGKDVITQVGGFDYQRMVEIAIDAEPLIGNKVEVGNPHFVIFDSCSREWLSKNSKKIAKAAKFANGANIEFVSFNQAKKAYDVLVHERGAGFTMACGTGGVAIMGTLYKLGKIKIGEKILLNMPGGILTSYINKNGEVVQQAPAEITFTGEWPR
jgi:diaminopimelate epimerase